MAHQKQGNGRWQKRLQDRCEIVEHERGRARETPLRGLGNGTAPATLIVGKGLDRVIGQGVEKGWGGVAMVGEAMDVDNNCTRGCGGGLKRRAAKNFFQESQFTGSFVCFREGENGTEGEGKNGGPKFLPSKFWYRDSRHREGYATLLR